MMQTKKNNTLRRRPMLALTAVTAAYAAVALVNTAPTAEAFVPNKRLSQLREKQRASATATTFRKALLTTLASTSNSDNDDQNSWVAPKSAMIGGAGVNNAGEPPFEIRGFSLGNLTILLGLLVTVASFAEYLGSGNGGDSLNVSGLGFVYGIPIFLGGAALKYAEIDPVPVVGTPEAEAMFELKATETLQKIKQDVTRHRYGDEAHLDTSVKKLGLVIPGKDYPQLHELRQEVTPDGELAFTLVWQSVDTPYKMWADERRVKKYETFFGPGVSAQVIKVNAEQRLVGIRLTTGKPKEEVAAAALDPTVTAEAVEQ